MSGGKAEAPKAISAQSESQFSLSFERTIKKENMLKQLVKGEKPGDPSPRQMIATQHMELEPRPEGQVCAEAHRRSLYSYV